MLNENVSNLINEQINKEFYSAYLYLAFSNYYYDQGLDGFGHWYDIQAQEERDHAMLMRTYLQNNGYNIKFTAIDEPEQDFKNLEEPLVKGLAHEEYVTSLINKIYKAAKDVDDFRTMQCFDWFVKEQGEEEKTADDLLKKYRLFGSDPKGLYALNQELLGRVYTTPSLVL